VGGAVLYCGAGAAACSVITAGESPGFYSIRYYKNAIYFFKPVHHML
jgi:hypothetical protein